MTVIDNLHGWVDQVQLREPLWWETSTTAGVNQLVAVVIWDRTPQQCPGCGELIDPMPAPLAAVGAEIERQVLEHGCGTVVPPAPGVARRLEQVRGVDDINAMLAQLDSQRHRRTAAARTGG